ncbi:methyl-accepting chemotaxis protein [bacterium]|nr:methyl-accepting chemotaxis protein [bacterium]RQV97935.1 MAG: methyl-accepting chemotaxis protein [bacterium]
MQKRFRIQKKLLIPYLGSILLLFSLFSLITFMTIRDLVRDAVTGEAQRLLEWDASEIRGFLVERGRIPLTLFKDPFILDWFSHYNRFRAPIQNDPGYYRFTALCRELLASDSTLNSVYFATDNTEEYFDEEGRYEQDGYFVKDRPWWHKAVRINRLYCELGGYDYEDSTMAASLQMPVYMQSGRFLGIGGIDIEIKTIGELVAELKYHGQGQAFMINESGDVFVFPGYHPDLYYMRPLRRLDDVFSAQGFRELAREMMQYQKNTFKFVHWNGTHYIVFFHTIQSNQPYFRWQLAFMVPEKLVNEPVRQRTWAIMQWIFLAGILIIAYGTWRTLKVLRPLDALASRLHTIANEKSDLTQELPVFTKDAIGQTAKNFNLFLGQIRQLVSSMIHHTKDVADKINHLHEDHQIITESGKEMSDKIGKVANTSGQMVQHVEEVMLGVKEVTRLSKQFLDVVDKGKALVRESMQSMGNMAKETVSLYNDMQRLHKESDALINMVKVIDDINERVAMLAINASIEAVKAGEQGAGFSVVAKEIETLSMNTSNANRQTLAVIQTFSESMDQFKKDLQKMKETMVQERHSFIAISEMFLFLADQAHHTDKAAVQMHIENQQQVESLQLINDSIQHISEAAQQVAESISHSSEQIRIVHEHMQALQKSADAFKVE